MLSVTSRQTVRPLRFVRWSRRSSATFHSIGREVVIGHLAANVVERLSLKSASGGAVACGGRFVRHGMPTADEEGLDDRDCLLAMREAGMLLSVEIATSDEGGIGSVRT